VLLAWQSERLRHTCWSSSRLTHACAGRVQVTQDLLGAVAHAPTLAALARSRCIRVERHGRVDRNLTGLIVGLEEVQMFATPLTPQGHPIHYVDSIWPEAAGVTALRIDDLEIAGASLLKAAS